MARSVRTFGTHRMFRWHNGYRTKVEARNSASKLRKQGRWVRVIRGGGEWEVWSTGQ